MDFLIIFILLFLTLVVACVFITRIGVVMLNRRFPPTGAFIDANGTKIHYHHIKAGPDKPTIIFIHGANGTLHDAMSVYRPLLEGKYNLLFFDRPSHAHSGASRRDRTPKGQAETLTALMEALDIEKAVICGHSYGGAVAVSFALYHPEKASAQLLLAPVSHPWPGGVKWYYTLMTIPILGWLFSETLALPAGLKRLKSGTVCVFAPNIPPSDYLGKSQVPLLLRPKQFRDNGWQISVLHDYVSKTHPRYTEIITPTIILTGNRDTVVLPEIHSVGLAHDIEGAELHWVKNLGHKPDYIATDFVVAALENLAGSARHNLQALASELEERLAENQSVAIDQYVTSDVVKEAVNTPDETRLRGFAAE